jgi:hypothetical protein
MGRLQQQGQKRSGCNSVQRQARNAHQTPAKGLGAEDVGYCPIGVFNIETNLTTIVIGQTP